MFHHFIPKNFKKVVFIFLTSFFVILLVPSSVHSGTIVFPMSRVPSV